MNVMKVKKRLVCNLCEVNDADCIRILEYICDMYSPDIRLSLIYALIKFPIYYITTKFREDLIWHVICGWAFTIGKPIFKVLTYDVCRSIRIMACKMLWTTSIFLLLLMESISLLINFTTITHKLQSDYEHSKENTLQELIIFFSVNLF